MKKRIVIREQLSLSQQELADYLQVSRSVINLYELGIRQLPVQALIKLGQLEIICHQAKHGKMQVPDKFKLMNETDHTTSHVLALQKRILECRQKAASKIKLAAAMQQEYHYLLSALVIMDAWLTGLPQNAGTEKARLQSEIRQHIMYKKLKLVSPAEQFVLQHRAEVLLAEAAAHEGALDKLAPGRV